LRPYCIFCQCVEKTNNQIEQHIATNNPTRKRGSLRPRLRIGLVGVSALS
jgi:hypothetical protein